MTNEIQNEESPHRSAQTILQEASDIEQRIIREILSEERKVSHQKRRSNIHENIVDIIKRNVQ